MNDPILTRWTFTAQGEKTAQILPDGCVDVLLRRTPNGASHIEVSPLQTGLLSSRLEKGVMLTGYRMRPGVRLDPKRLTSLSHSDDDLTDAICDRVTLDNRVEEALSVFAHAPTLPQALRTLGVQEQTLQRVLRRAGLPPPKFWLQLARARRAGRQMTGQPDQPLADLAIEFGYADQAHLTRSFHRFFNHSPRAFRKSADLYRQLDHTGLATGG